MNLVIFHLRLQVQDTYKGICECNRIIYNTDIKPIIKTMKNKRRNKAKFLMELEESINILSVSQHETSKVSINKEAKEHCSHPKGRNDCRYKDKTLLVCLMRKCVYCDVVDSDPSKGYLC